MPDLDIRRSHVHYEQRQCRYSIHPNLDLAERMVDELEEMHERYRRFALFPSQL